MLPNSQEAFTEVTFIEEILNGKLHFLFSVNQPRTTGTTWHGIVAYHLPEAKYF